MSFIFGYLLDEHMPWALHDYLSARFPDLRVFHTNDGIAPPNGTQDPELLIWCETNDCALVTNNRRTMPRHLIEHCKAGRHVPGIFTLVKPMTVQELAQELILVAGASFPGEYTDQFRFLPL
jgi:hypothetical protein